VPAATGAHLLLAGPDPGQVADDPEAQAVLAGVRERWRALPPRARARVHIACLPLTPPEDNAAMVNAIQRLAAVMVNKSLQEGFGLRSAGRWSRRSLRRCGRRGGCWRGTLAVHASRSVVVAPASRRPGAAD